MLILQQKMTLIVYFTKKGNLEEDFRLVKQTAEKLRNMWFFTECLGQFVVV
jgi:hypothetical protein